MIAIAVPASVALPERPALDNPPSISADELHRTLVLAHRTGNVATRRFGEGLRAMAESGLYTQLGYSSIVAYAEDNYSLRRSQVFEHLRVAKALVDLVALGAAFERGEISWSLTAEIVRVATAETESSWLEYARTHRPGETSAELRDATAKRRAAPRRNGYGLPGLPVRLAFTFSPADHAVLEAALAKVAQEMRRSTPAEDVRPEEALLYLATRVLSTSPEGSVTEGRPEREDSAFLIVSHRCPDCRRGTVETAAGRVELDPVEMERIERVADEVAVDDDDASDEKNVARDGPNTPALRRKLRHRAGLRCENPACRHPTGERGHGHHVVLRCRGGATTLGNETWVCVRCHAMLHSGSLSVSFDAQGELCWRTRAGALTRSLAEELDAACSLPIVRVVGATDATCPKSGLPDFEDPLTVREASDRANALRALTGLGWSRSEAERRVARALTRVQPGWRLEDLFREALRG